MRRTIKTIFKNMKTKIIFAAALIAFTFVNNTFAYFNPKTIFEAKWTGYGKQMVDETTGEQFIIHYDMYDIYFDAVSFTFTGKKRTSVELDGQIYSSTVQFKAKYQANIQEVYIQMGALVMEDALPGQMQWAHNNMRTTLIPFVAGLFKYQMKGATVDLEGNSIFEVEFYNEPTVTCDNP